MISILSLLHSFRKQQEEAISSALTKLATSEVPNNRSSPTVPRQWHEGALLLERAKTFHEATRALFLALSRALIPWSSADKAPRSRDKSPD